MEESEDIQTEEEGAPVKRPWGLMIAVIVAVGVLLWLLPGQENPEPKKALPAPTPPSEPVAASGAEPSPEPATGDEPASEVQIHPGERGRAIIALLGRDAASAQQAFTEAQRLQQEGHFEDAYLLYFFSAKQGQADAALTLGTQADPAHFDAKHSALHQADPGQAYKWYRMAADNGSAEAGRRLATLHAAMKKAAAAGDEKAARLMLQWK